MIGDLPEKFLEKYFTPDVMMELLEEQFMVEDNHKEITAIIEAREKYYLSKLRGVLSLTRVKINDWYYLCCDANHVKGKVYLLCFTIRDSISTEIALYGHVVYEDTSRILSRRIIYEFVWMSTVRKLLVPR